MKTSLQTRQRRAISPIIATILVVAMTIVAAGVLYTYFTTTASRAQNTTQIQIQASLVVPNGSGAGEGTVSITNSGSIELTALQITANGFTSTPNPIASSSSALTIAPGGGTSYTFTSSGAISGNSYSITVVATFANGATQSQVVTITAE